MTLHTSVAASAGGPLKQAGLAGIAPGVAALLALALFPLSAWAQQTLTCRGGQCVQVFSGRVRVGSQLRVRARGPVALQAGGSGNELSYSAEVRVRAANEAAARRALERFAVRVEEEGGWSAVMLSGEPLASVLTLRAPRLSAASISTLDGLVDVKGVDGSLDVNSIAGQIAVDRVGGLCRLVTRGGSIRVGAVSGPLESTTAFGSIAVTSAQGDAVLQTMGGDVVVAHAGGRLRAQTGAGAVRVQTADGAVDATTGGGEIWVGKAKGMVRAHNVAGLVRVDSAAGVRCDSAAGRIQLGNISGSIRASTAMGSIIASLLSRPADSYLATGNGDITVVIPSNLSVTIQAENEMADTVRRIVSEFPQIPVRREGTRVVAEGRVNGGGPVLRISSVIGTIFIKRQ